MRDDVEVELRLIQRERLFNEHPVIDVILNQPHLFYLLLHHISVVNVAWLILESETLGVSEHQK